MSTASSTKTWQERNFFLLNNEFMSDCSFIVQDGENKIKLPAHKYVLGGCSWEFYNFFFLMEAASNEIPITDVSVEVVKIFLEFIYRESVQLNNEIIWDVLKLAERYSVKGVKVCCDEFLSSQRFIAGSEIQIFEKVTEYKLDSSLVIRV